MTKLRFVKAVLSVLVILVLCIILYNFLIEESSTLSTFSYDGYKDLNKGEMIYIISQNKTLKGGALILPNNWKEKFSVQITFPRILGEGMRRLTLKAEGQDLVLSSLGTKPLKEIYRVEKHSIPYKPKLKPVLP